MRQRSTIASLINDDFPASPYENMAKTVHNALTDWEEIKSIRILD